MIEPVKREKPSVSAWFRAARSMARFAACRERHDPLRPGPDRRLLERLLAHPRDVLPGDDPPGRRRRRAVEGHEVRPRLPEMEPDAPRVDHLHLPDLLLQQLGGAALVA